VLKSPISLKDHPLRYDDMGDRLRTVLANAPNAEVISVREEPSDLREQIDARVDLRVASKSWTLLLETKSSGQPRHVREAAASLRRALASERGQAYGVFVAPFLSAQSQEILRSEGLGWLDLAGNTRLSFGGLHIEIERAQRDPFATKRAQQSLFAPKSARVLRAMLADRGPWKVMDLSEHAGVSLGQVSNVRRLLLDKEWAEVDPAGGMRLRRADAVLDAWREAARPPVVVARAYTVAHSKDLDTQLRLLFGRAPLEGARVLLAGHSVARRLAPFARVAGEFFYADDKGLDLIERHFKLAPTDKGENITVFSAPDDGLWTESIDRPQGMKSAGLIQTYLDLWSTGERGREAAEHFRRELMASYLVSDT